MANILVIAPYQGLADLFQEAAAESGKKIRVEVGDLSAGLAKVRELGEDSCDVIISRGATARLLREHCRTPVVDVKVTGYDLLRTLTLLRGYPGKIGLVSYRNTVQRADEIGALIDMNLEFYPIEQEDQLEAELRKAKEQGIAVMVGDVISTQAAARLGIKSILITSGREAVMDAIDEAERLVASIQKEREARSLLEAAFAHFPGGLLLTDPAGEVLAANEKAIALMRKSQAAGADGAKEAQPDAVRQLVTRLVSSSFSSQSRGRRPEVIQLEAEREDILAQQIPLEIVGGGGAHLFVLKSAAEIRSAELLLRKHRVREREREQPISHVNQLVATSDAMKRILAAAEGCSQSNLPVLLLGEAGTEKKSIAWAIHNASERCDGPFVTLDCAAHEPEQLTNELFGRKPQDGTDSPQGEGALALASGGTLFIDHVSLLPPVVQSRLLRVLQERAIADGDARTHPVEIRLIAADARDLQEAVEAGTFSRELHSRLSGSTLLIPPLRHRMEDLEELVRWMIASYNQQHGKQIVGMREEALALLKKRSWPGNLAELEIAVHGLCERAPGPFIEAEQVMELSQAKAFDGPTASRERWIDLGAKTLEELEREIIIRVLEEEGQNQSQAAKRLGIDRSTLWRKIKQLTRE